MRIKQQVKKCLLPIFGMSRLPGGLPWKKLPVVVTLAVLRTALRPSRTPCAKPAPGPAGLFAD